MDREHAALRNLATESYSTGEALVHYRRLLKEKYGEERLPEETMLLIVDPERPADPPVRCSWYEFRRDNMDGVDLDGVEAALLAGKVYTDGGGAAPLWTVRKEN